MINTKSIPKVELHVHLDGSLNIDTVSKILNIPKSFLKENMIAQEKCLDLNDYLTKFDLPVKAMQKYDDIKLLTSEFVKSLEDDNVIYAEVRFAPLKHTSILSPDEVINSVLEGIKSEKVIINLILCMMRGDTLEDNKSVIDLAHKYLKRRVVAIDLAGAEGLFKTSDYEELFNYANKLNIPFTIHAGEADGVSSIESAIKFGARRIGHGIRVLENMDTLEKIKDKNIMLEICPTSNIQTNVVDNIINHPIKKLFSMNTLISINTDNRTVSNVTLSSEYDLLIKNFNFDLDDLLEINRNSIIYSFADTKTKQIILDKINNYRKE